MDPFNVNLVTVFAKLIKDVQGDKLPIVMELELVIYKNTFIIIIKIIMI